MSTDITTTVEQKKIVSASDEVLTKILITALIARHCGIRTDTYALVEKECKNYIIVTEEKEEEEDRLKLLAFLVYINDWENVNCLCEKVPISIMIYTDDVRSKEYIESITLKEDKIELDEDVEEELEENPLRAIYELFKESQKAISHYKELWDKDSLVTSTIERLQAMENN